MKLHTIIALAGLFLFAALDPTEAAAQGRIFIRGIPYENHSSTTRLDRSVVGAGQRFAINSRTLRFRAGQDIRVILEPVGRGPGFGVTVFRATQVRITGPGQLVVTAPNLAVLRNRTYAVTLFVFERGQFQKYADTGRLTIR